ncbi:MAG: hypothetical protein ACYCPS_00950 [Candidatus Saccharimonadales bacterium]
MAQSELCPCGETPDNCEAERIQVNLGIAADYGRVYRLPIRGCNHAAEVTVCSRYIDDPELTDQLVEELRSKAVQVVPPSIVAY